ncbi:MAG: LPP20 family lipoprotein [Bacteroidota bacterium]
MKKLALLCLCSLVMLSCGTTRKHIKTKPEWVFNRPVNTAYYVGVGIASKKNNPIDFQQIAKKNALNDLIAEIKVTVASNSVLSQFQNNTEFKQQFESESKISALNTIENFQVVDSWEDADNFWIYYRLSKEEFAAARRRRLMIATERAEDFFQRAESFDIRNNYMQAFRSKVKALAALQEFLNEDIQSVHNGKQVYLVNEILSSMQSQLYKVTFQSQVSSLKGKVGKPVSTPFDVLAHLNNTGTEKPPVPFMPMKLSNDQGRMEYGAQTETDHQGMASFSIARILAKDPVQLVRISTDLNKAIMVDSLSQSLRNILLSLDVPSTSIRVNVEPIKMFMETDEKNLSARLPMNYVEPVLKKLLIDSAGCNFVRSKEEADYLIKVSSNTKSLGIIWGNMYQSSLNLYLSLVDNANDAEVFKDALMEVKGFQTTPETAGVDAYKTANDLMQRRVFPKLKSELLLKEK